MKTDYPSRPSQGHFDGAGFVVDGFKTMTENTQNPMAATIWVHKPRD